MKENFNKPENGYRKDKPRFGDKPSFNKSFKKPFDRGGKTFDRGGKTFDKGKKFNQERKISTFKACIVRLERFSREEASSIALEKSLQELMEHFPLAVFGYASQKEISIIFDLSENEVYGNNADKLITVAASLAGVVFTRVAEDGRNHYFSGALFQPFKDRVIDYFEERQAKFGGGLIAFQNEEGVEIEDAKSFIDNKDYLLEKLKNVSEERKEEFKTKNFNDDRPKRNFGDDRPRSFNNDRPQRRFSDDKPKDYKKREDKNAFNPAEHVIKSRSFKDIDTTKSQGFLERQALKKKSKPKA